MEKATLVKSAVVSDAIDNILGELNRFCAERDEALLQLARASIREQPTGAVATPATTPAPAAHACLKPTKIHNRTWIAENAVGHLT